MFLHGKCSIINPDFPNFHLKIVSRTKDIGNKISSSDVPSGWILPESLRGSARKNKRTIWNRYDVLNNSLFSKWLKCEHYANIWGWAENSSNVGPISTELKMPNYPILIWLDKFYVFLYSFNKIREQHSVRSRRNLFICKHHDTPALLLG